MIFSKQKMETAFSYQSAYYDKILFVDFKNDSFQPIRVETAEWNKLPRHISFSEWVKLFLDSTIYRPCKDGNKDSLEDLISLRKNENRVMICNYFKLIDGDFHIVQMELYPSEDNTAYLFVRDLTKMQSGIPMEEE